MIITKKIDDGPKYERGNGYKMRLYCLSRFRLYKTLERRKTFISLKYFIPKRYEIILTNSHVVLLPMIISLLLSLCMLVYPQLFNSLYSLFDYLFLNQSVNVLFNTIDYTTMFKDLGLLTTGLYVFGMNLIMIILLMVSLSVVSYIINVIVTIFSSIIFIKK